MRPLAVAAAGAALLLPVVSGCAAFEDGSSSTEDGVRVAAGFYPLEFVADRVAGDLAEVENLTSPGGEPHDLELTPRETADVARADLVVYERGFQPAVDDAVDTNATGATVDVADAVELRAAEDGNGDTDPHFWHDPLLMADLADAVAEELAQIDPANAEDYRANADDLRGELETLDQEFADGLAQCERNTVVVSHDAFGYLSRYGLEFEGIAGLSPDAEPTPADLAKLQELIADEGVTTVFYESLVSPEIAEQLAADTGAQTDELDPIEGLTDETADEDYLSLMRANLAALEEANGC